MFSADAVPKGIYVITAKLVFAWKTDSDGYITKAKARLVAHGFGHHPGVTYFNTFVPTSTVPSIKSGTGDCRTTGRYTILMLSKFLFR